jgi:hypothetical protein
MSPFPKVERSPFARLKNGLQGKGNRKSDVTREMSQRELKHPPAPAGGIVYFLRKVDLGSNDLRLVQTEEQHDDQGVLNHPCSAGESLSSRRLA